MSAEQIALLIGVIAASPIIGLCIWQAIKHGSGGNT
jgi:hypothetical protein